MRNLFQKWIVPILVFCSLLMPSLVYSGSDWYQSLVALKWLVALVPLGCLAIFAACGSFHDKKVFPWCLDEWSLWGVFWLIWSLSQPLWTHIRSIEGWLREHITFVAFWVALWTMRRSLDRRQIPLLLILAGWVGGVSSLLAEAQLHQWYPQVMGLRFVMNVTEGYVGNVGQQNLLAFWLALTLLCSAALTALPWKGRGAPSSGCRRLQVIPFVLGCWGLWGTTSRSGLGAFLLGLVMLSLLAWRGRQPRKTVMRLVLLLLLFGSVGFVRLYEDSPRGAVVIGKTLDMVTQWHTLGSRAGIWRSSFMVLLRSPVVGVGLGQFKWHYLEGQKVAMDRWPDLGWQYTQWAHNEVLQWACEFGLTGLLVLLIMVFLWLSHFGRRFRSGIPPESCWAVALLTLFVFGSVWTRPLRRPEYVVWLACSLAVANRWLFAPMTALLLRKRWACFFGLLAVGAFWYGSATMTADKALARALKMPDGENQITALELVAKESVIGDWAGRELARARLRLGEQRMDTHMVAQGLNELNEAFLKTPTSSDLRLLRWYGQKHNLKTLMKQLTPFGVPPES